jgi:hypothetical protein
MLSLKRRYRGSKAQGNVSIAIGLDSFAVRFGGEHIEVRDRAFESADVVLIGEFEGWFPLLSRTTSRSALEAQGKIERRGPARLAKAFIRSIGARP